ncbi:hypothetical protein G5B30_03685 [Sphingobacterium sp. SGG-5]|uniref:hypothetical protein n=1 Tax=Sphingobacterium sp. SGG-5 TaxID=2710881 RepID=UPI0013E9DD8B|nr:hypothetical protein [Sphingobacterium sp. SGG-5]NGM61014.1 hypothetical protein [Sphingobacterium sp. SGG-5]
MNEILQGMSKEYLVLLLVISLLFQVISLILAYQIRATLRLVRKENRFLVPGQAWVIAIPLINIFYNFIVVRRLTDSLNNEFFDRQIAVDENPTRKQGYFMAYSFLALNFPLPAFIGYLVVIACLICYINYGIKVNEHKKLLMSNSPRKEN